ncbi:hypothetical protein [Pseudomonas brenneri]
MESTAIPGHGGWPSSTANHAAPGQSATQKHLAYPIAQRGSSGPSFDSRPQAINYATGNDNRRSFSAPSMASSARNAPDYGNGSSESGSGVKPKDIWGGFSQGQNSDCITISAIKAAMVRFGQKPADVFKEVKETGDGMDITMRDGVKVHLSQDELKLAEKSAKLQGSDPEMMKDAAIMYAASAKRAQDENNDGTGARSFTEALRTIENGEEGPEGLLRLGLKNNMKRASAAELLDGAVGIVNRAIDLGNGQVGGHSMAVINGMEEQWGKIGDRVSQGEFFVLT